MRKMTPGKTPEPGDIVLVKVQFTDTFEVKLRPALILFEEYDNVIVAGITSNTKMQGIPLTRDDGAVKNSVIKLNYIFTISKAMINRKLFQLSREKRLAVFKGLSKKLSPLSQ